MDRSCAVVDFTNVVYVASVLEIDTQFSFGFGMICTPGHNGQEIVLSCFAERGYRPLGTGVVWRLALLPPLTFELFFGPFLDLSWHALNSYSYSSSATSKH